MRLTVNWVLYTNYTESDGQKSDVAIWSKREQQKWLLPPWKWDTSPLWSVRTSLVCGSMTKKNSVVELLADAIRSINDAGSLELIIYTDGSSVGGIAFGGSAAIVTEGPPTNPTLINYVSKKGNRWTSSYET